LDKGEFCCRILRFNWFGHQSRFDLPLKVSWERAPCITGHLPALATSLPSIVLSVWLRWLTWSVNADRNYSGVRFGLTDGAMNRCRALSRPGPRRLAVRLFWLSPGEIPAALVSLVFAPIFVFISLAVSL
jgi:hypothetical protein